MSGILRRASRPPLTQARLYRLLVPGIITLLVLVTVLVLALAGGVLLGILPYPGRERGAVIGASWALPVASSLITGVLAALVFRRYMIRGGTHLLVWGAGLTMFGIVGVTELISTIGWHPAAFRLWYLCGAVYVAAWLGQGTVYLLSRRRRLADLTTLALLIASLAAAYLMFSVPVNAQAFDTHAPLGVQFRAILSPGSPIRKLTPVFNIYGTLTLVGGALYSAWLLWRKEIVPQRVLGNVAIAAGGLSLALSSTLARLGTGGLLSAAELTAAVLMFAGFLLATARPGERRMAS